MARSERGGGGQDGEAGFKGHAEIDFEQLLSIDPDFFMISAEEDQGVTGVEAIPCETALLADLLAVREKRRLRLPDSLYLTASLRILLAAEGIAEQAETQLEGPEQQ